MTGEISLSREVGQALLEHILKAVDNIDSEYPGHYSALDPFIHLLTARLTGDERGELEVLLEKERK